MIKTYNKDIKRLIDKLDSELHYEVMVDLVEEVKDNTPVDTGDLKAGYDVEKSGSSSKFTSEEDYWPHLEMGTSKQSAQPHISPVFENTTLIVNTIKKVVNRHVAHSKARKG